MRPSRPAAARGLRLPLNIQHEDRQVGTNVRIPETRPVCDSVTEVKTPTTYSSINLERVALKAKIRRSANVAKTRPPLEKTSLSPRFMNCRGRKRSLARIEASRGKS